MITALEQKAERWKNYYLDPELAAQAHAYAKEALHLDDEAIEMPDGRISTVSQEIAALPPEIETPVDDPNQAGFDFSAETEIEDGDIDYSVIMGEKGAANLDSSIQTMENLTIAKQMLGEKTWEELDFDTKSRIKQATGWEVGADGKWRLERMDFELKDPYATNDQILQSLNERQRYRLESYRSRDNLSERQQQAYKALREQLGYKLEEEFTFEDFITGEGAADLFKAYPQLRQTSVRFEKLNGTTFGYYNLDDNLITLDASKHFDKKAIRRTLTHEIQHAIQKIEGFAIGGNITSEKMARAAKRYLDAEKDPSVGKFDLDTYLTDYLEAKEEARKDYQRLAGEVEARNAADRPFNNQHIRSLLLEETEGINRDEQIVKFDNAEMSLQPKQNAIDPAAFSVENMPGVTVSIAEGVMQVDGLDTLSEAQTNQALDKIIAAARESGAEVKVERPDKLTKVQKEAIIKYNDTTPSGIEAFYTTHRGVKKSGWMKAPNGKHSNLDKRQWTHVRATNFKNWFGDWEGLLTLEQFKKSNVAQVKDNIVDIPQKKIQERFRQILAKPMFYNTPIGQIVIDKRSARKTNGHNYSQKKVDTLLTLQQDFANAVYIGSAQDYEGKALTNHYFAYPIEYGNNREKDIVFCRVREDVNVNRLYVHEVFLLEEIEKGDTPQIAAASSLTDASHTNVSPRGRTLARMILKKLYGNNPQNVSKIVDENGEPLVVYHGTRADFKVFEIQDNAAHGRKLGDLHYFTPDYSKAHRFANGLFSKGQDRGGKVMACYLNIRNPLILNTIEDCKNWRKMWERGDYDGIIDKVHNHYAVKDSTQIKSATDNSGAYDGNNPNIEASASAAAETDALWKSTLESTVYPNGGRVPVAGSPAAKAGRIPLALHHIVGIYRDLAGKYPKVVKQANRGPREALGWFRSDTKDIFVRAQLFGLLDASDAKLLRENLKRKGFFRNEDPNWCANQTKKVQQHEKKTSDWKLQKAMEELVNKRIKAGIHQGVGTKVLAHELWHYIDQIDGIGTRQHGNFLGHIFNLKNAQAEVLPEADFTSNTELLQEASNFIQWWRGISMPTALVVWR